MPRNKIIPYQKNLKFLARQLRNNSTKAEFAFWQIVKNRQLGVQFHRQVPIDKFIVDFYCHEHLLAIELDGNSHFSDENKLKDSERDKILNKSGVEILRFTDSQIFDDTENVINSVKEKIIELDLKDKKL